MDCQKAARQFFSTIPFLFALALAPSCGNDEDQAFIPPPVVREQPFAVVINIDPGSSTRTTDAFGLNPLIIQQETVVTWVNTDNVDHTVTALDPTVFDSGLIQPGESFSHRFGGAGTFEYRCLVHPNMRGTLQVNASAP